MLLLGGPGHLHGRPQPASCSPQPGKAIFSSCQHEAPVVAVGFHSSNDSGHAAQAVNHHFVTGPRQLCHAVPNLTEFPEFHSDQTHESDRKSTRLNSSHVKISYAVFCLKKKKY